MSTWALVLAAAGCQKPGPPLHAVYRADIDMAITLGSYGDPMQLQQEAKDLVGMLRAGALPVPIQELTFQQM